MKSKRRRPISDAVQSLKDSDRSNRTNQFNLDDSESGSTSPPGLRSWLIPGLLGAVVGGCVALAYVPILLANAEARSQRSVDNSLLVTQQLDELFNMVQSRLEDSGADFEAFQGLLNLYGVYDMQFTSLNNSNEDAAIAVAFATNRMGYCSLASGDSANALIHYQQAQVKFENLMRATPEAMGLLSMWMSVQTQIIFLQIQRNDIQAARDLFQTTLLKIKTTPVDPNIESSRWLAPRLKSLAELGIQLKLFHETLGIAVRYDQFAQILVKQLPVEPGHQEQAREAKELLERLAALEKVAT